MPITRKVGRLAPCASPTSLITFRFNVDSSASTAAQRAMIGAMNGQYSSSAMPPQARNARKPASASAGR